MFHSAPLSRLPASYAYAPSAAVSPRDRYLAALAEAKAAETEYLAAEAVQREEAALRQRLDELQFRKQLYPTQFSNSGAYSTYGYDRLAALRRQVEEEERLRLLVLRKAEEEEEERRLQAEARRIHQTRAEVARLHQEQQQEAILAALRAPKAEERHYSPQAFYEPSSQKSCRGRCQVAQPPPSRNRVLIHPVALNTKPSPSRPTPPVQPSPEARPDIEELFKQIFFVPRETSKPKAPSVQQPSAKASPTAESDIEELFKQMFFAPQKTSGPKAPSPPPVQKVPDDSTSSHQEPLADFGAADILKQFADLFRPPVVQRSPSQPSASSSKQTVDEPSKAAPAPSGVESSGSLEASLKEQLEARLNNEYHTEVKDTIQAIFASLQDTGHHSKTNSSFSAGSSKGKGKASETLTTPIPSDTPTSMDVVKSLHEVDSIETAFQALESDFTFPARLDFIPTHFTTTPESDSDSGSATLHLSYTSRNHPVRFYEQALGALLTQLDSISSFGNESLRERRKEVVGRVEKALEELEKEVDGRWRTGLYTAAKKEGSKPVEAEAQTEVIVASPTPDIPAAPETNTPEVPTAEPILIEQPLPDSISAPKDETDTQSSGVTSALVPTSSNASDSVSLDTESTDTPIVEEDVTPSPSLAASVQGDEVEPYTIEDDEGSQLVEPEETFLLAATSGANDLQKRPNNKDDDAVSDWSEVEA